MLKKFIGDREFYRRTLAVTIPIIAQNGITQFVNLLDNIMVGQVGTQAMTAVAKGLHTLGIPRWLASMPRAYRIPGVLKTAPVQEPDKVV